MSYAANTIWSETEVKEWLLSPSQVLRSRKSESLAPIKEVVDHLLSLFQRPLLSFPT